MKRLIYAFIMMILLYLLQTTIFNRFSIAGIKPNIIINLVVLFGYKYGRNYGIIIGFLVGILFDLTEGAYIGYYAILYMSIGYFVGFCTKLYNNESKVFPLFLVGISDFFLNFSIFVTSFLLRNRLNLPFYFVKIILPELIYTIALSFIAYRLIDLIFKKE